MYINVLEYYILVHIRQSNGQQLSMSQLIRIVIFFIIFYIVYLSVDWIRHYPGIFRSIFSKINDDRYFNYTLKRLLIPRWPMSRGHDEVLNFIFDNLKNLGFEMFRDEFIDRSKFTNIVAIMNSRANNFLMLSCHYDSKLLKESDKYVGATDGAVSCAILLNMAHSLKSYLNGALKNRNDIGLLVSKSARSWHITYDTIWYVARFFRWSRVPKPIS